LLDGVCVPVRMEDPVAEPELEWDCDAVRDAVVVVD